MKRHGQLWVILFTLLALMSCSSPDFSPANDNTLKETWISKINTHPEQWTRHADSWFFTGNPDALQHESSNAPMASAMTTMVVKVPQFTHIEVAGDFQVQIVGQQARNSVYVLGPNATARLVDVSIVGDTLYIRQPKECPQPLNNVIIRIGVSNLRQLTYSGRGDVTGRDVTSTGLTIHSYGSGTILMNGPTHLVNVTQNGTGTVTIINTQSPHLDVADRSSGNIHISGRVGITHLINCGNGEVNIIGADSNDLSVDATGNGLTTVVGHVKLRSVHVQKHSCVYIYWVDSMNTTVSEQDQACVGLAGSAEALNINLTYKSEFAGQYLHGTNVYIHTYDNTRATVSARSRLFAAAEGTSMIYYFGSPAIVSQFTKQQAVILPMQTSLPVPTN